MEIILTNSTIGTNTTIIDKNDKQNYTKQKKNIENIQIHTYVYVYMYVYMYVYRNVHTKQSKVIMTTDTSTTPPTRIFIVHLKKYFIIHYKRYY